MYFFVYGLSPSSFTSFAFNMPNFYRSVPFCVKFLQKKSPSFFGDNRKVAKRYFYAFVLGAIVSTRLKSRELIAPFIQFSVLFCSSCASSFFSVYHVFRFLYFFAFFFSAKKGGFPPFFLTKHHLAVCRLKKDNICYSSVFFYFFLFCFWSCEYATRYHIRKKAIKQLV